MKKYIVQIENKNDVLNIMKESTHFDDNFLEALYEKIVETMNFTLIECIECIESKNVEIYDTNGGDINTADINASYEKQQTEQPNTYEEFEKHYLKDKLLDFINKQNEGVIGEILKKNSSIIPNGGYVEQRLQQAAYQFGCNPNARNGDNTKWWKLTNATQSVKDNMKYYLGLFFLDGIYEKNADYDYNHNGRTDYLSFLNVSNEKPYLLSVDKYRNILNENLSILFDNVGPQDITYDHIKFVHNKIYNELIKRLSKESEMRECFK